MLLSLRRMVNENRGTRPWAIVGGLFLLAVIIFGLVVFPVTRWRIMKYGAPLLLADVVLIMIQDRKLRRLRDLSQKRPLRPYPAD